MAITHNYGSQTIEVGGQLVFHSVSIHFFCKFVQERLSLNATDNRKQTFSIENESKLGVIWSIPFHFIGALQYKIKPHRNKNQMYKTKECLTLCERLYYDYGLISAPLSKLLGLEDVRGKEL